MLYLIVTLGGLAALSWELLWQIHATLALGVSAKGTAITLAATMGGMSLGAFLAGKRFLSETPRHSALKTYGNIELVIGISRPNPKPMVDLPGKWKRPWSGERKPPPRRFLGMGVLHRCPRRAIRGRSPHVVPVFAPPQPDRRVCRPARCGAF